MGKKDRIKRVFKDLRLPSKVLAAKSASNTPGTGLEPHLNEPTTEPNGASSTGNQCQDPPVKDLWDLALATLSSEDRQAISLCISDSKLNILQHLQTAAVKKQTDCEDRRWKFELNGRQIILRDVAEKIIVWIDKFKQIGDIAVNFDPVHASLPWAGVRFLLETTVAESQQMGALLTGVEKMTSLIGRCQIYEALYLHREQFEEEGWKKAVLNLTSALVALYAIMLNFLGSAIRAYNQNTVTRTLHAILNPAEIIGFLDRCQILENNVVIEVDNCERIDARRIACRISHQIQTSSEEQIEKLKQLLAGLQAPILRIDSRVAALCERLDSSERLSILEWISSIPYEENHFFARQGRTNGTGKWLLGHERYREWRASSASMILWLHGDPGAGKTKLISTVVDDLLEAFKQLPNDEAIAYFYCDRNQSDRQEPAMILSSLVRQLSTPRNNDAILRPTIQMYNQKRQTGFASGKLKLEESQAILAELFHIYPQITLVVDALDECDRNTRSAFFKTLDTLVDGSPKPLKILVSSRRDRDIKHRFEDGPNLDIRAIDNRDDIAAFVNHEIATSEKFWQDEISSELKELICTTLVDRSEGMFQWVSLQITALRELCRERDIRNRLGKLPKTLKTAYDELILKIQSQEESTPVIASRAFQWVMCSSWPLSPAELVTAVCQDPETDEIDEVDININTVLGACQNLLVVDQELNVCRFSHLSVQEYFETHHWNSCETNCLVGKVCLLLLIANSIKSKQDAQPTEREGRDKSAYDILEYACFNWVTHVQRLEEKGIFENRLVMLLKAFLGSMDESSLAYQHWYNRVAEYFENSEGRFWDNSLPLQRVHFKLSPCSQASLAIVAFGFYKIILDWWALGFANVNSKSSSGVSLLQLGAKGGSVSIIQELLDKGADVNASGGEYGSALQAASRSGVESVVQLLLNKGADINATGGWSGSALQTASACGQESIVQLLLDRGADVNASGGRYGSALQAASKFGYESVVRLLLDRGADVNASGGVYGSVLAATSRSGSESIVKLLLNKGADVNASGGWYGSALASACGQESIVQLLLDRGADVNASGGWYGSALQTASACGQESIVQLLLDRGADVSASGGRYGSALQTASKLGYESVVRLLLDRGADVNPSGGEFGGALQAASYSGFELIVKLLLDKGADVNASGGRYGSTLQTASACGQESIVQLLLDRGADVNASSGRYGSALQAASACGQESIVQLLLDRGADVNASGGEYGSALKIASSGGHETVVTLLQAAMGSR